MIDLLSRPDGPWQEVAAMSLALVIMLSGALGAVLITLAARPAADRFLRW